MEPLYSSGLRETLRPKDVKTILIVGGFGYRKLKWSMPEARAQRQKYKDENVKRENWNKLLADSEKERYEHRKDFQ